MDLASLDLKTPIKAAVERAEARVRPWAEAAPWRLALFEFVLFGLKQAWACLFAGLMLALLLVTHLTWPDAWPLARYDFLVVAAVAIQAGLLLLRLERPEEAVVIAVFHVVGTVMELFKTAHGSWTYPEDSVLRIGGVPLFSGFMYACVGSYMARVVRLMDIGFRRYPPLWATWALAVAAYLNFFTHHYVWDARYLLFALSLLVFWRTSFVFRPDRRAYAMPAALGLVLVALFIWLAENLGTFAAAWTYPDQRDGWRPVSLAKVGSWYLLILLSWVLVTLVHRPRAAGTSHASSAATEGAIAQPLPTPHP